MIEYAKNPDKFYLFALLVFLVLLLFYMTYSTIFARKKKVKEAMKKKGRYRLKIESDGILGGDNKQKEKVKKIVYTDRIYMLQTEDSLYGLPRRVVAKGQEMDLEKLLKDQKCQMINLILNK